MNLSSNNKDTYPLCFIRCLFPLLFCLTGELKISHIVTYMTQEGQGALTARENSQYSDVTDRDPYLPRYAVAVCINVTLFYDCRVG
jgi:hypothetical protein